MILLARLSFLFLENPVPDLCLSDPRPDQKLQKKSYTTLLGLVLIALASSVLLFSDMDRRKAWLLGAPRVALLQYASQSAIDESVKGMIYGLAEAGFIDGESIAIQRYQAEGEMPTLNLIAREIADGAFDLILTSTTPALQAVANANKQGKLPHVFGLVADPAGAGVGISREDPLDHPRHLVGLGTLVPVEQTFRLARLLLPSLSRRCLEPGGSEFRGKHSGGTRDLSRARHRVTRSKRH